MPFNDKSFDVVVASEIIEHIYDTDKLLQEFNRILKDNGFLVITTPNLASLARRLRLLVGISPQIDIGIINEYGDDLSVGHIRYFTFNTLKKLLERNNFEAVLATSDYITFNKFRSKKLAKILPTLGFSIVIKAQKTK